MSKIQHILVPTDGSEGACRAAGFAGELARTLGARVTVLLVQSEAEIISHAWGIGDQPASGAWGAMTVNQVQEMLERQVREKELPETIAAVGGDVQVDSALVWGRAAEAICDFADRNGADMIVIGTHGRTGIKRALLGSVSNAVVTQAPCPVTIVR